MSDYNHSSIECKWQGEWSKSRTYSPDLMKAKKPFYNLMMFPYSSAEGLHIGNMYAFTGADVYGRFQRMRGYSVFEPIGLDGFGIHSENYAIKVGKHPKEHAQTAEKNFYRQLSQIGNGFAWDKRLETYDPNYYKWTQWLFIKMYQAGLVYKGKARVNWCPSCKTVLADEQAAGNRCERCGHEVVRREMASWFFKITKYADRLLDNLKSINWPQKIKIAQEQWIGKSFGMEIKFERINVFTTRPDTIKGATFLVLSPERAKEFQFLVPKKQQGKVSKYIEMALNKTEQERKEETKKKTGVSMGFDVMNPITQKKIPVWVADYVLSDVGTGAIMGVPAHDERDALFAKKYKIDIVKMQPDEKMWDELENKGLGKRTTNYHLRDWLISRQRYWGPPIPMLECPNCGLVPVSEKDLPVLLPDVKDFKPKEGHSPLENAPDKWKFVKCPKCGSEAKREVDVSDTFLDSSWYFLAYPNLGTSEWKGTKTPLNKKITQKWLPVNAYIGGAEHAVLHLLYSRFVSMVLYDLGFLKFEEPFPFLYSHGLIIKDGAKMSKSKGNIVVPDAYVTKFGADTLRTYLMFLGPYGQGGDFRDTGIEGMYRFIKRVWGLFNFIDTEPALLRGQRVGIENNINIKMHQTIKKVTEDLANFRYNTAISAIMEYVNALRAEPANINHESLKVLAQLIAPFAPHLAEEAWVNILGEKFSIHLSGWPSFDAKSISQDKIVLIIEINGKKRSQVIVAKSIAHQKKKVVEICQKDVKVAKQLQGKKIKDVIFIPEKIVNFVIG